jgi:hypothetical protein
MMLASGQVCYGCSKAGTSPLWFGVTLTVRSDRPKTPTYNTRNSALCDLLSSHFSALKLLLLAVRRT